MFYLRDTYRVYPERLAEFQAFFKNYLLPNQIKNGAQLIGQWTTEAKDECITLWEYPSYEDYLEIESRVKKDKTFERTQAELLQRGQPYREVIQDILTSTEMFQTPKQAVSVSGYITNDKSETLLVRTYWRADTWELPGGGVDDGETLDTAILREIFEETGIHVKLIGITGVYSNGRNVNVVFRGICIGGKLTTSKETKEVQFIKLNSTNVDNFIKRPKFRPRVIDAMKGTCIPHEAFKVRPYKLIQRLNGEFN